MNKCIIIDDDQIFLDIFSSFLESANIDVLAISSTSKAIETIKEYNPDLIVLDQFMPKIKGTELASKIKEVKEISHIPILIISAQDMASIKAELKDSSCIDYIDKSSRAERIIETVRTYANIGVIKKIISKDE